jgi:hypothetical protein
MADMPIDIELIKKSVEELDEAQENSFEVRYMLGHILDEHHDLQDGLHDVSLKLEVFFL